MKTASPCIRAQCHVFEGTDHRLDRNTVAKTTGSSGASVAAFRHNGYGSYL